jgi:hypothetical protein
VVYEFGLREHEELCLEIRFIPKVSEKRNKRVKAISHQDLIGHEIVWQINKQRNVLAPALSFGSEPWYLQPIPNSDPELQYKFEREVANSEPNFRCLY